MSNPRFAGLPPFPRVRRAVALALLSTLAASAPAVASTGGTQSGSGGAKVPPRPVPAGVVCVEDCVGVRAVAPGSTVEIAGRRLDTVERVEFQAGDRRRTARARVSADRRSVQARVPRGLGVRTARMRLIDSVGRRSARARRAVRVRSARELRVEDGAAPSVVSSEVTPRLLMQGRNGAAMFSFVTRASSASAIRIDVVREADGAVVRSMAERNIAPNSLRRTTWDGRDGAGQEVDHGRYLLVARPEGSAQASSVPSARRPNVGAVSVVRYIFPVRGSHRFGDGLGAGRGHQGADVFARCGTRMVAAIGGRVTYNRFQSRAGYYLVIRGDDGIDYFYAHLQRRSTRREGSTVGTGDTIGAVGETGNASGCHLHFEMWSKPGWHNGGRVLDPMPYLREWARQG